MKYRIYLLLSFFFLKLTAALAASDTLRTDKSYLLTSIYSGVSFGKNQDTYGYGGRFAGGVDIYYYKNRTFGGLEIYKTSFKDHDKPDFKVGHWIKTKAVQKVNVFSANIGRQLGVRQNMSISGGLGLLQYKYPILKYHDTFFSTFSTLDRYRIKSALCLNSSFKIYSDFQKNRLFGLISAYASKPISFVSIAVGIELKLENEHNR